MKISTKGRYGIRAMLDLALHDKTGSIALGSIAERQGISVHYLEQLFSTLRRAGLVKSIKGAQGGYLLVDIPKDITIGEILRALEGDLRVAGDFEKGNGSINTYERCLKTVVWDKMEECMNRLVESLTLEDLRFHYRKLNEKSGYMYYI